MTTRLVVFVAVLGFLASADGGFAQQKRQTISFPQPPAVRVGDKPLKLEARATSKLPVSYSSSNKSVARVSGSTLVILRAGSTTVTATQAGNKRFLAAKPVKRIVVVSKRRKPKPVPAPAPTALIKVQGGKLPAGSELAGTSVASFQIGKYEVTWAEWKEVRAWASWNGYDIGEFGGGLSARHPVMEVNWYDVLKWCNAKSELEKLQPVYSSNGTILRKGGGVPWEPYISVKLNPGANGYRLPTPAEWEWAARGGVKSKGFVYSGGNAINSVAWHSLNSKGTSQKVGGKTANELGIHDMSGNVGEWTWSVPQYLYDYQSIHGGSWYDRYYDTGDQWTVKSSYKNFPGSTSGALGFRLALNDKVVPRPPKAIPTPRPTPKPALIVTRYNDSRSFSSGSGDYGLVSDKSGNLYFAGGNDGTIRKVLPSGNVTLFAGRDPINGNTVKAVFQWIHDISVDGLDNLYIPETTVDYSYKVTKISPSGAVSTFASGNSTSGWNGTGPGLDYPRAIALDSGGNIFIGERYRVRKITPGGTASVVAGSGSSGSADGIGTAASFNEIQGLAVDKSGNLYVADTGNHKIRKISPTGVVSTLAGADTSGSVDGAGATARFNSPQGIAVDSSGNVYVADTANNKIRKISPAGVVATLAGTGLPGATNGPTHQASFYQPTGVTIGKKGEIYIHDSGNGQIRKISPPAK